MPDWWISICANCQKYIFVTWKILGLLVFQTKLCRTLGQSSLKTIDQDCSRTIRTIGSLPYIICAHVIFKVPLLHYYAQAVGHWLFNLEVSLRGVCGGCSGCATGFSQSTAVLHCHCHYTNPPCSFIHLFVHSFICLYSALCI